MTTEQEHQRFPALFPKTPIQQFEKPHYRVFSPKALEGVGFDAKMLSPNYQPEYLPLKLNINTLQAENTLLFLRQYYRHRGNLGSSRLEDFTDSNGRGVVIGDGTGTGKSRSVASQILSVIAVEQYMLGDGLGRVGHPNRLASSPICIWLTLSNNHVTGAKQAFRECLNLEENDFDGERFKMESLDGDFTFVKMLTMYQFLRMPISDTSIEPIIIFTSYPLLHKNMAKFIKTMLAHPNKHPSYMAIDEFHTAKNITPEMRAAIGDVERLENDLHIERKAQWMEKLKTCAASGDGSNIIKLSNQ